jgi:TonB-linked SusC/RagA family outer membrane protein
MQLNALCPRLPAWLIKTLRVMKLITFIMLSACLQIGATGASQTVTLSEKNASLERVFGKIKQQTGYVFFYSYEALQEAKKVTVNIRNASIEYALAVCLKGQPLTFSIENKTVFITKATPAPDESKEENIPLPPVDVKGRVIDENGGGVTATITVKGTRKAVPSDNDGYFELQGINENAVLVITGIGIETREIGVGGKNDLSAIVVKRKTTPMDEIQVVAYGSTSRRFNVGTVSTISSKDIQKQPVTNVLLALQGRVPGLVVTPTSGAPGAVAKVQVRGQNSLVSSMTSGLIPFDQPLIIIDGVPFAPQNQNVNLLSSYGGGSGFTTYEGLGAMSSINPADIESISVLKDADATSIYGSQGANGVILITTKKGTPGKTRFSVSVNTGPNKITRHHKFLNTQQYLDLRREAFQNDGIPLPPTYDGNYPDLQLFDTTKYTDWFKEFFGKTSNNTDVYTNLTGGTETSNFILSAGYNHSSYNFPGDYAEKRLSLHSGFHFNSKNNKFSVDFGTDFSYSRNNNSAQPSAGSTYLLPPNAPDLLDASGNLIWNYKGLDISGYQLYAYLKQPYKLNKYNLNNNLQLSYKMFPGLSVLVNLGYNRFTTSEVSQVPIASQSPNFTSYGTADFAKNEFETINIEPQLNYQRTIGKGVFTALIGGTYKSNSGQVENLRGTEYTNDGFLGSISGAGFVQAMSSNTEYKYIGAYGRAGYVYDNKYILNITGRRDGSSNFGPGRQYGTFGSMGAGWILTEETILKNLRPVLSLVKLSANYGTNGSDGVAPYNYQDYWSTPPFSYPFQGVRPYYPVNLYNPDYSWSLKKSLNISLDLGFFNDRLLVNAVWYKNKTGNQLVGNLLPDQTGFMSVTGNLDATIQNTGWEFFVSSSNIKTRDFTWTSNLNFSTNRNKLLEFFDLENSPYANLYIIGESTSIVTGYLYKGVNETTGIHEFYDRKGDPTYTPDYRPIEEGGDRRVIADVQPKLNGGLENTFSYKGITLSCLFQFAKQTAPNYLSGLYTHGGTPGSSQNMPVLVLDRWRNPGDRAAMQRATADYFSAAYNAIYYFTSSSGVYQDVSYIRLKTLSLAYTFPSSLTKKAGMENLRLYVNAQNLLTFTNYKFGDPELPGQITSFPMQRNIAFGLSFNF